MKKINGLLAHISTKNIAELNELIYAGANLVSANIDVPRKNMDKSSKPGKEIRLETQKRKLRQQAKTIRQRKNVGTCWDEKKKVTQ